jgi:hypothetical protein
LSSFVPFLTITTVPSRLLLRCGADPAAANARGESPLSHAATFLAAMAAKAHIYEPEGRIRKSRATRDREAIAALLHSSPYRVAVLRRLRRGAWGQQQQALQEEEEESTTLGVLRALVRGANDDVFDEALSYLNGDSEEEE